MLILAGPWFMGAVVVLTVWLMLWAEPPCGSWWPEVVFGVLFAALWPLSLLVGTTWAVLERRKRQQPCPEPVHFATREGLGRWRFACGIDATGAGVTKRMVWEREVFDTDPDGCGGCIATLRGGDVGTAGRADPEGQTCAELCINCGWPGGAPFFRAVLADLTARLAGERGGIP